MIEAVKKKRPEMFDIKMDYKKALEFIHSVSWLGSRPGLERTRQLLRSMGNPERACRFIHIAGTNGKGSTAAMLSDILTCAGYKTGLYTSPYLLRFNERIKVNGEDISDDELAEITALTAPHAAAMSEHPTEFELVTAIAFAYYAARGCDIVVLETGLGGRLDSTNVIENPDCAVITAIGLDHTRELGETLSLIAAEKAGIIKPGCDVVSYERDTEAAGVIEGACQRAGVRLRAADFSELRPVSDGLEGQSFHYRDSGELFLPLLGEHQLKNAAVALETVRALRERGFTVTREHIAGGLKRVRWPARFELVSKNPWFVLDGGHNPQCAESVRRGLERYFPGRKAIFLLGVLKDKDYAALTDILDPAARAYIAVAPVNPRALPAAELAAHLERYGKPVRACGSASEAVAAALETAGPEGLVCAVGSLYMAGDLRSQFLPLKEVEPGTIDRARQ